MAKVFVFPQQTMMAKENPAAIARRAIENRFGISFSEFMGVNGKRTPEVQEIMKRALRKETMAISTKSIEE
jgi:hypothetical protein